MNIDLLRDFLFCAKTLSLTRTAELRNTSQSNISKRLRLLEHYLGQDLIDRNDRPIALTQAGWEFLPIARQVVSEIDAFRARSALRYPEEGVISVAMPHNATVRLFPRFKERLLRSIPDLHFACQIADQDVIAHMVTRSEVDLAIVTSHPDVSIDERLDVIRGTEIASDRLVIVSLPDTNDTSKLPLHISHELTYLGKVWQSYRHDLQVSEQVQHGLAADIRAHCLAGRGRGVLPLSLVDTDIVAGNLVCCHTDDALEYKVSLYCSPYAHKLAKRAWASCNQLLPVSRFARHPTSLTTK
ncbi:LysR family transcriptional regulator [uncultured Roseobacter sp.]|uniref:LysR family transcriptional regulator n=1 Tax=uncultured Roseobacter sp. TaxID=114847 RepID=UPI00261123B8|nr:LysR family transcriptional regulator [uncultured Roseobacter sp.]